jgi:hypothetical protein
MKIPKEIKVGAHTFKVFFPYCFKETNIYNGYAHHERLEIMVAGVDEGGSPRAGTKILATLLHELIHCIDVNSGGDMFSDDVRERNITVLSEGLTAVLIDNGFIDKEIEHEEQG